MHDFSWLDDFMERNCQVNVNILKHRYLSIAIQIRQDLSLMRVVPLLLTFEFK